jgi:hypothetical protein
MRANRSLANGVLARSSCILEQQWAKIGQNIGIIMELDRIIAELETYTGKFPRLALARAIEEREAITPLLLATLQKWTSNLEELVERPNYFLHIYALYLLAQFKEVQAYPIIIEFFSVPGETALDVVQDVATEDLGRILASVSNGDIEPIKQLIENRQINEYIRSAALDTLIILVIREVITKEVVIEYFQELFSTRLEREYSYVWTNLVMDSAIVAPLQLKQQIDLAFELDLVDRMFFNLEDVDYYLQLGREASLDELRAQKHYSTIEDPIGELERWHCFQDQFPNGAASNSFRPQNSANLKTVAPDKKKAQGKMQKQARKNNRSKKR